MLFELLYYNFNLIFTFNRMFSRLYFNVPGLKHPVRSTLFNFQLVFLKIICITETFRTLRCKLKDT